MGAHVKQLQAEFAVASSEDAKVAARKRAEALGIQANRGERTEVDLAVQGEVGDAPVKARARRQSTR